MGVCSGGRCELGECEQWSTGVSWVSLRGGGGCELGEHVVVAGVSWLSGCREHTPVSCSTSPGEEGEGKEPMTSLPLCPFLSSVAPMLPKLKSQGRRSNM